MKFRTVNVDGKKYMQVRLPNGDWKICGPRKLGWWDRRRGKLNYKQRARIILRAFDHRHFGYFHKRIAHAEHKSVESKSMGVPEDLSLDDMPLSFQLRNARMSRVWHARANKWRGILNKKRREMRRRA